MPSAHTDPNVSMALYEETTPKGEGAETEGPQQRALLTAQTCQTWNRNPK